MGMSAADYLSQLQALLPPGPAWPRDADATLTQLLAALADEFARVDLRAENLLDEADPRTTTEMLPDWERMAGLPDTCVPSAQTMQERRAALHAKLTTLGGQSRQYFIDLAAALGYTVTITEFSPFRVSESAVGDALYSDDWMFAWRVNAPTTTIREFRVSESAVGEPLRSWGNDLLECAISRRATAHTHVLFGYS